jgi:enoyl-CoA hydratase/carnithine racemase
MGQTEINLGLASLLGAHIMEPFLGRAHTIELTLTGRLMDGQECHKLGLLNYCVEYDEIDIKALSVAQELADKPPVAMSLTKERFREATQHDFDKAFEMAIRLQSRAYESGEPQRVMNAFLQEQDN